MFRIGRDEELTGDVLEDFLRQHMLMTVRYTELKNQYITKPPILYKEDLEAWKPDDRIPVNFGKYIVDTYNGFFNGIPVRPQHENEDVNEYINDFWRYNNMDNVMSELAKTTSIYGLGYLYLYQNEESRTEVAYNTPMDMFIIYSDEIRPRSLYGVRYTYDIEGVYRGQIFTDTQEYLFTLGSGELVLTRPLREDGEYGGQLYYGRLPILEFVENEERMSLIEPVEPLINSYNRVLSEKSNDVSYFADAYLTILGARLDDESLEQLKANRIINLAGDGASDVKVQFLEKPDADVTQENFLDRVERLIFQTAMVVNLNDDKAGNRSESSGVALARKEQPMANMALNKEHKYTQSLQTMFGMVFNVLGNVPTSLREEYKDIKYLWKRNLPANNADEADTVYKLEGIVSRRKQLEMLSAVDDVQEELDRQEEERGTEEGVSKEGTVDVVEVNVEEELTEDEVLQKERMDKLKRLLEGKE